MPSMTTFASRVPATFIRGTVFDTPIRDSATMLAEANLANWDVRLRAIETDARSKTEAFEVIRTNPFDGGIDRLGISGERYVEFQNETVFGMLDHLDNVEWEAAGSFKNGALVYGQAKSDTPIVLDPGGAADEIQPLVTFSTGHGGKGALRIGRAGQRMDCLNMFNVIFNKNMQHAVTIRHTKSGPARMQELVRAWKANAAYFTTMEAEAQAMFAQSVTDKQFFDIVAEHFVGEKPDEKNVKGALTKWETSNELYAQAWKGKPNEKARGTAWGVFQALIEKNQWSRTIQKTENGLDNFAMAGMGFDNSTNAYRQKAFDVAKSLVTV
jgi:hypothetical protein